MSDHYLLLLVIFLGTVANGIYAYIIIRTLIHYGPLFTIGISIKAVGLSLPIVTVIACILALAISAADMPVQSPFFNLSPKGALAVIVPLALGVHVATTFAAEDEAALEVMLTHIRPFGWIVLERVYLLVTLYSIIGFITTIFGYKIINEGSILEVCISWFSPSVLLAGIGLRVSVATRHIVFGIISVLMLWGGLGFFSYLIAQAVPQIWALLPYPPEGLLSDTQYLVNRVMLILLGNALFFWATVQLNNSELVLMGRKAHQRE